MKNLGGSKYSNNDMHIDYIEDFYHLTAFLDHLVNIHLTECKGFYPMAVENIDGGSTFQIHRWNSIN